MKIKWLDDLLHKEADLKFPDVGSIWVSRKHPSVKLKIDRVEDVVFGTDPDDPTEKEIWPLEDFHDLYEMPPSGTITEIPSALPIDNVVEGSQESKLEKKAATGKKLADLSETERQWIGTTLTNDESMDDTEMINYFIDNGIYRPTARALVSIREKCLQGVVNVLTSDLSEVATKEKEFEEEESHLGENFPPLPHLNEEGSVEPTEEETEEEKAQREQDELYRKAREAGFNSIKEYLEDMKGGAAEDAADKRRELEEFHKREGEIKPKMTKQAMLKKMAEVESPWCVEKDANGNEVIVRKSKIKPKNVVKSQETI